jgi:hypothetical protein
VKACLQYLSEPDSATLTKVVHPDVTNLRLKHPKKSITVKLEKYKVRNFSSTDSKITNISILRLFKKIHIYKWALAKNLV